MSRLSARSTIVLAALAVALVIGTAAPARGAVLWTLTASPLTVTTGARTTFSLRASMTLLGDIRCIEVSVPGNFTVHGASVVGSNAGESWISEVNGNDVWVRALSGGDRLRLIGHYVDFTISATATSAGSVAWDSHAHEQGDCTGTESLLSVPPVVLVLGPAVTPAPAPTIAPTPTPRPTATPRPSLLPSVGPLPSVAPLPSVLPPSSTATPRPSPASPGETAQPPDAEARQTAEPRPSVSSEPSAPRSSDGASPGPGVASPPSGDGGAGSPRSFDGRILAEPGSESAQAVQPVPVALGSLGLLGSIDIWIVPGLLLGVPGLLVVAFVALQAIGALAWIPAVRRLRGSEPESGQVAAG